MGGPLHDRGPRPPAPGETRVRPPPEVTPQAQVAALASAAGNRAIARLLQREEAPVQADAPKRQPLLIGQQLDYDSMEKTQDAIKARVREYLEQQREVLLQRIAQGMAMTEVVDDVRQFVPGATRLAIPQIEEVARTTYSGVQIPAHRLSGVSGWDNSELAAIVRNAMGIPTKLEISQPQGWVKLSVSGYEVGLRKGENQISAEAGWDKSFGMKGKVGPVWFGGVVKPPATPGGNVTWEAELGLPRGGRDGADARWPGRDDGHGQQVDDAAGGRRADGQDADGRADLQRRRADQGGDARTHRDRQGEQALVRRARQGRRPGHQRAGHPDRALLSGGRVVTMPRAALLAALLLTAAAAPAAAAPTDVIRVGGPSAPGEAKLALVGSEANLAETAFSVLDEAGATVLPAR